MFTQLPVGQVRVRAARLPWIAVTLSLTCSENPFPDDRRGFASRHICRGIRRKRSDRDGEIKSIAQGARQLLVLAIDLPRCAPTRALRIAVISACAGIHCCDDEEARRKHRHPCSSRDSHGPLL